MFDFRPIDDIQDEEFAHLVAEHTCERQHLEYKVTHDSKSDGARLELLCDVASLANGGGGYLIFGIRDDGHGRAQKFEPDLLGNPDRLASHIQMTCGRWISDPIPALEVRVREVDGNPIVVVRVPQSQRTPHMVAFRDQTRFVTRSDDGKRSMSLGEIREMFIEKENLGDKLEVLNARMDDIHAILANSPMAAPSILERMFGAPVESRDRESPAKLRGGGAVARLGAPSENIFTAPAQRYLALRRYEAALEQAQESIRVEPKNPLGYFLAGQAYIGLRDYAAANSMYNQTEQIFPAYELDVEPAREQAWADAFNTGVNAYAAGQTDAAVAAWEKANTIYNKRAEAYQNLAAVYSQLENYDKAIQAYQDGLAALDRTPVARTLTEEELKDRAKARPKMLNNLAQLLSFTKQYAAAENLYREQLQSDPADLSLRAKLAAVISAQPGREADAQAMYSQLLAEPDLSTNDVMNVGVALFNSRQYGQAAQAFKRVAEASANSRDAWYNYANALYASDRYEALVVVAEKLGELDPLNEDAGLILAQAYKETKQNQKALQVLQQYQALPIKVQKLQMQVGDTSTTVRGQVKGNKAPAGMAAQLRFNFYGEDGTVLGTQTVIVDAPEKDQTVDFTVILEGTAPAESYNYQLLYPPLQPVSDSWWTNPYEQM